MAARRSIRKRLKFIHITIFSLEKGGGFLIRGVIFDMDGLMADTLGFHNQAFVALFKELGVAISAQDLEETYGKTASENIASLMSRYGLSGNLDRLVSRREEIFLEISSDGLKALPGIAPLVRKLHERGYRLAVASSSRRATVVHVLKTIGTLNYFEGIVSAEDVKLGKPSPEAFIRASEKLGLRPGECIVLEDTSTGLKAAVDAGIPAIIIPNKRTANEDFYEAKYVVDSANELLGLEWLQ